MNALPPPRPVISPFSAPRLPFEPQAVALPAPLPAALPQARWRVRHILLALSFVIMVLLPSLGAALYLYRVAADQYVSELGFSVRSEASASPLSLLGGLGAVAGANSSDSDILYRFLHSRNLIDQLDRQLDLRKIYGKPQDDPWFRFDPDGSIEDLTEYWRRMLRVDYDTASGLLELRVHAFSAQDAQTVARSLFANAAEMINALSDTARADATRYAKTELAQARARLDAARLALTDFRSRHQFVDPGADVQGQMALLNDLHQQRLAARVDQEMLQGTTHAKDPRLSHAARRLGVIDDMIAAERKKLGFGADDPTAPTEDFAALTGEYERLSVERGFAEQAYLAALAAYHAAEAEAQRKSRYLAAYTGPSLPQEALYPQRFWVSTGVLAFALLGWSILVLIYYSLRDRR